MSDINELGWYKVGFEGLSAWMVRQLATHFSENFRTLIDIDIEDQEYTNKIVEKMSNIDFNLNLMKRSDEFAEKLLSSRNDPSELDTEYRKILINRSIKNSVNLSVSIKNECLELINMVIEHERNK